jgi:hypothetical protein
MQFEFLFSLLNQYRKDYIFMKYRIELIIVLCTTIVVQTTAGFELQSHYTFKPRDTEDSISWCEYLGDHTVFCKDLTPTKNDWQRIIILMRSSKKTNGVKASIVETLSRISPPKDESIAKELNRTTVENKYLWKAVYLLDFFYTHKGWTNMILKTNFYESTDLVADIQVVLVDNADIDEHVLKLHQLLVPYFTGELLNTIIVTLILSNVSSQQDLFCKNIEYLLNKRKYQRSCIRWLSLTSLDIVRGKPKELIINYLKRPKNVTWRIKATLMRFLGLKGTSITLIDNLGQDSVEYRDVTGIYDKDSKFRAILKQATETDPGMRSNFTNLVKYFKTTKPLIAERIKDKRMYLLMWNAHMYFEFRKCKERDSQIEYLKKYFTQEFNQPINGIVRPFSLMQRNAQNMINRLFKIKED